MKVRSQALFAYLQQAGVLNETLEAIALAKKDYRRLYKTRWKQRKQPLKEIRFEVTSKQYQAIKANALFNKLKPTAYCKNEILSIIETTPIIPQRDMLLQVLQLVSMAVNGLRKDCGHDLETAGLLGQAEKLLLTYVSKHEP